MFLSSVATGAVLLVTSFQPSLFDSCLSESFYGNFIDSQTTQSVFLPDEACLQSWLDVTRAPSASISQAQRDIQQLVWVEQEVVDAALLATAASARSEFDAFLDRLRAGGAVRRDQTVLTVPTTGGEFEVLYQTPTAALLSVSPVQGYMVDTILPRFWKSTLVPTAAVKYIPVPDSAIEHAKNVLSTLSFNPEIAGIVDSISVPQMIKDIRFLTGEDEESPIMSRHSFSDGSRTAASWLKDRFEETGATCELQDFLIGFTPNVVCAYPSLVNTTATVLLSAHYDSRGSFGSTRAPGGDDDGSGTMAILAIARTIARKDIKFHSNVQIVAFGGEEQGLLGSKAYAKKMRAADANITVMIQADMLAYHAAGEPAQLGLPLSIGTPEIAQLVANVSKIYSPELRVGVTAACCSDHQSFWEQGFPSTQVFERAGPIVDPMYHNSGDLSERDGYDFDQVKSIAKVQLATLLHSAGYEL